MPKKSKVRIIENRSDLVELRDELGLRCDWHEPDENDITAVVKGTYFDNAYGSSGLGYHDNPSVPMEKTVYLKKDGKVIAQVNLATLFAFATGYTG